MISNGKWIIESANFISFNKNNNEGDFQSKKISIQESQFSCLELC